MDLYQSLISDDVFLDYFCDVLEDNISDKAGYRVNIGFKKSDMSIFFFIDGSHTYEYCKNDSEKCWELCGGRGVFLWHDCDNVHPGVIRLIAEWRHLGRDIRLVNGTALAYLKTG